MRYALALLLLSACDAQFAAPAYFASTKEEPLPALRDFDGDVFWPGSPTFNNTPDVALPVVVWLALDGLEVRKGPYALDNAAQDTSPIPNADAFVPALDRARFATVDLPQTAVDRALRERVQAMFSAYAVDVVTERPSGAYTTVVVGGTPSTLGLERANLIGIAPLDAGDRNKSDVAFAFASAVADKGYDLDGLVITIVHELAHTLGLQHIDDDSAVMAPGICRCSANFGSGAILDADGAPTDARQDSHAALAAVLLPREAVDACTGALSFSIPSTGRVLGEEGGCLSLEGDARYWRREGGHFWTGSTRASSPSNRATWTLSFERAGEYTIAAEIPPSVDAAELAHYVLDDERVAGVDQRNAGSAVLTTRAFDAERTYVLSLGDNTGVSGQRVLVDALAVTPAIAPPPLEPTCAAHPLEAENHDFDSALVLDDARSGIKCAGTSDFFVHTASTECAYQVRVHHDASAGNLGVMGYDQERRPRARSFTQNDIERAVQTGDGAQIFWAVRGQENAYEIERDAWCRASMQCPDDDPYEPNDNNEDAARLYKPDRAVGITCDDDVYRFFARGGCTSVVRVNFVDDEGDIDLRVVDRDGQHVARSLSATDDEEVRIDNARGRYLFARVYGYRGAQNTYRLELSETCD